MLVLSRKIGEVIHIDEDEFGLHVEVTIIDVERGKVRVGISAPRNVKIFRQELVRRNRERDLGRDQEEE